MSKLRLDSWKSIADYLQRSPRTVQRWHACHGLPVHHFGGCKGSVFAYSQEIDRWLAALAGDPRTLEAAGDDAEKARKEASLELTARARQMWEAHSEENLHTVAGLYRKAINQDPGNAKALIGLADALISASVEGVIDSSVAYTCASEALRQAAQIDSHDLDLRCSQAWLNLVYERKGRQARAGFEEVLGKQPTRPFALAGLALLHIVEGDPKGAFGLAWDAWMQNPLVCSLGSLVCWTIYLQGDLERVLELVAQVRASGGSGAMIGVMEAFALNQQEPSPEGLSRIEAIASEFPQNQTLQGALGYARAASGQTESALDILANLEHPSFRGKPNNAYGRASVLAGLGSALDAASSLQEAYAERSLWSIGFHSDPILLLLRSELGNGPLLQKLGAPLFSSVRAARSLEFITKVILSGLRRQGDRLLARA